MKLSTSISMIFLKTILSASAVQAFMPMNRVPSPLFVATKYLNNNVVVATPPSFFFSTTTSTKIRSATDLSESNMNIPTIEQLSSDSFMKQVGHASNVIVPLLGKTNDNDGNSNSNNNSNNNNNVKDLLKAQLSHSDGIRGFFVSYLTGDGETAADGDNVPTLLIDAMNSIIVDHDSENNNNNNNNELISLACMNVIMPVAMVTMHEDVELAKNSEKTAKRGAKILKALIHNRETKEQCKAIRDVAMGNVENREEDTDIKFWIEFFDRWGYKEMQKQDIQNVMVDILKDC